MFHSAPVQLLNVLLIVFSVVMDLMTGDHRWPLIIFLGGTIILWILCPAVALLSDHMETKKEIKELEKEAKKGNHVAMCKLALCYSMEQGEKNEIECFRWLNKALGLESFLAMFTFGAVYMKKRKYQQAFKWWIRASALSHSVDSPPSNLNLGSLYYNLAVCYYKGTGVNKNRQNAIKMMQKAVAYSFPGADCDLKEIQQGNWQPLIHYLGPYWN